MKLGLDARMAIMAPMRKSSRSASEFVYRELREDLALCRIRPGERLLTEPLRARFGVSFTVIREALARLAAEGFCVADPQKGFTAAEISAGDILMLTEARIGVENLCLRESILLGDAAWQEDIARLRDEVLALPVASETHPGRISQAFLEAHDRFHDSLVAACTNHWMMRVRTTLHNQSSRYRQICIPLEPVLPSRESGYREIAAAVMARDYNKASSLIGNRFRRNTADFVHALETSLGATRFWCDVDNDNAAEEAAKANAARTKAAI